MPAIFDNDSKKIALGRHISSPNYEMSRFMSAADALECTPIIIEYHHDKFTSNNLTKHRLARMGFHSGRGRGGGVNIQYRNIVDFNTFNGKPFCEIKTRWGQNFVDFHHEIFLMKYPLLKKERGSFFDASYWLQTNGGCAKKYYKSMLSLFVRNAILFENYSLQGEELGFVKEIFLPAFFDVWKKTTKKPLIVALEPTEIEDDEFWLCYTTDILQHIDNKKNNPPPPPPARRP